jgi:hypothetical protein
MKNDGEDSLLSLICSVVRLGRTTGPAREPVPCVER